MGNLNVLGDGFTALADAQVVEAVGKVPTSSTASPWRLVIALAFLPKVSWSSAPDEGVMPLLAAVPAPSSVAATVSAALAGFGVALSPAMGLVGKTKLPTTPQVPCTKR